MISEFLSLFFERLTGKKLSGGGEKSDPIKVRTQILSDNVILAGN